MKNELGDNYIIKVKTKDGHYIEEPERENDDDLIIMHPNKPKTLIKTPKTNKQNPYKNNKY
jgi:hypothetical protein